jgi:septal ring factor EnvC (AmiA/AmiB activator)
MLIVAQYRTTILRRALAAAALGLAMSYAITDEAAAQSRAASDSTRFAQAEHPRDANKLNTLRQRDVELEAVRAQQKQAAETETRLKREIATIGDDRRKLNQALIDTATRSRNLESRVTRTEYRLKALEDSEHKMRETLASRRTVIAEILAALQRIGRHPPPAVIVSAEDALVSVRTAIMLGAVLPEMRSQAEKLASELSALVQVRKNISEEQERLQRELAALAEERVRTARLIEERQKKQAETEKALEAERQAAAGLARQADNLKDLIAKLEKGLDRASRVARAAQDSRANDNRPELAVLKDPGRLAPAVVFAAMRSHLPFPVNGEQIREYGDPDTIGGTEKGLSIATRDGAQVTSPCDGWVVYAAPFRNYGQVLILDASGGYHVVLAGMDRISVGVGQFVLTGEPVAIMGNASQTATNVTTGPSQSVLYVEFRKDGIPVDPSPWWATSEGEKVRG